MNRKKLKKLKENILNCPRGHEVDPEYYLIQIINAILYDEEEDEPSEFF